MSKNINYVPKRMVKEYKKDMHDYLLIVQENLKESGKPYFSVGIVGSAKRNLILRRGHEIYDVDFQLLCTNKDVNANYREDIYDELRRVIPRNWSLSQSTSTIFCTKPNEKEFDIALIKKVKDNEFHISKLDKEDSNSNKYIWNKLRDSSDLYEKRRKINGNEQWSYLRSQYKTLRVNQWDDSSENKKPSFALFSEAVNNTYNKFYGNN